MDYRPKCNPKTMQFLREEIEENLCGLGVNNDFLDMIQNHKAIQEKRDKIKLIKIKLFTLQKLPLRQGKDKP